MQIDTARPGSLISGLVASWLSAVSIWVQQASTCHYIYHDSFLNHLLSLDMMYYQVLVSVVHACLADTRLLLLVCMVSSDQIKYTLQ